jgi:hypothetical protein
MWSMTTNLRRALVAALLAVSMSLLGAPATSSAETLYPCLGAPADEPNGGMYPEPRIFLEAQAWWQPTVFGTENHGHIHTAVCIPRPTWPDGTPVKVSGTMPIAIRTILHENPGFLRFSRLHLTTAAANHPLFIGPIAEQCVENGPRWNPATLGCVWWSTGAIDTTIAEYDGYQEFRPGSNVQHTQAAGDTMFSSGSWQVYLANGKPVRHFHRSSKGAPLNWTGGSGWYLGARYENVRFASPLPYEVSGSWSFSIVLTHGAGGINPTHGFVSIDPDFHHGSVGQVLYDGTAPTTRTITVDTRTLTNGVHKLFLRTDAPCDGTAGHNCGLKADGTTNNVSTNSGAIAIPFMVNNV